MQRSGCPAERAWVKGITDLHGGVTCGSFLRVATRIGGSLDRSGMNGKAAGNVEQKHEHG